MASCHGRGVTKTSPPKSMRSPFNNVTKPTLVPDMFRTPAAIGILIALLAATLIGLSNVLAPIIYDAGGNPLTYLTLRFLGFVVLCRIWFWSRRQATTVCLRYRLSAYGSGTAYAVGAGALLGAFAYLPVSLAVLIFFTFPLLTGLFTCVLDRRWPTAIEIICIVLAFTGLALALEVSLDGLHPIGLGLAGLAAVGVSTAYVWSGRSLSAVDTTVTTLHMSLGGLAAAALVTFSSGSVALPTGSALGWLALGCAVLSFAGAFFSMFYAVRAIGAIRTAMAMNLEPIITIALSILILNESLSLVQLLGGVVVVGAVALSQILGRAQE